MRTGKYVLSGVLAIATMSVAAHASVTLLPDFNSNGGDGAIGTVTASTVDSTTQLHPSISSSNEKRGVIEIGISSIAAGSVINSATLYFDLTGFSRNSGTNSTLKIFGYEGNGTVTAADFSTASAVELATFAPNNGEKNFSLDVTSLLQGLVSTGATYIGFVAVDTGDGTPSSNYNFSTNYSPSASNYGPKLVVDYTAGGTGTPPVPEAASLSIIAAGATALLTRRRK